MSDPFDHPFFRAADRQFAAFTRAAFAAVTSQVTSPHLARATSGHSRTSHAQSKQRTGRTGPHASTLPRLSSSGKRSPPYTSSGSRRSQTRADGGPTGHGRVNHLAREGVRAQSGASSSSKAIVHRQNNGAGMKPHSPKAGKGGVAYDLTAPGTRRRPFIRPARQGTASDDGDVATPTRIEEVDSDSDSNHEHTESTRPNDRLHASPPGTRSGTSCSRGQTVNSATSAKARASSQRPSGQTTRQRGQTGRTTATSSPSPHTFSKTTDRSSTPSARHRANRNQRPRTSTQTGKARGTGFPRTRQDGGPRHPSSPTQREEVDPGLIDDLQGEIITGGNVSWSDVVGLSAVKSVLEETVVLPFLHPNLFQGLRAPPKAVLLFGPPGNGKTMIARALASQCPHVTFISISASSLVSRLLGDSERRMRALFELARSRQPCVIFMDEVDALLASRESKSGTGEHDSLTRLKTEFFVQLDGVSSSAQDRILVLAATNRPQRLDQAARRRFTRRLYVPLPDQEARVHILQSLMETTSGDPVKAAQVHSAVTASDYEELASRCQGYSGSDIATVCREASLGPVRDQIATLRTSTDASASTLRAVQRSDFDTALQRIRSSVDTSALSALHDWNREYGEPLDHEVASASEVAAGSSH